MFFSRIPGQEELGAQLRASVMEHRLGHALLFTGPQGSGNLPLALALARYIHCGKPGKTDACGECPACVKHNKLGHPDLHFTYPIILDKKAHIETSEAVMDKWREALNEDPFLSPREWHQKLGNEDKQGVIGVKESASIVRKLSLKAYEGGYKILIMWLPEQMNREGANKLLKILEEPPPRTIFLLVSNDADALLPTIISRTQILRVGQPSDDTLTTFLTEEEGLDPSQAGNIARLADGDVGKALRMAHRGTDHHYLEPFVRWMRLCFKKDLPGTLEWVEEIAAWGREQQKQFLHYGLHIFRQCMRGKRVGEKGVRLDPEELEFSRKFREFLTSRNLGPLTEAFNQAIFHLERYVNQRILFLDLSFEVFEHLQTPKRNRTQKRKAEKA